MYCGSTGIFGGTHAEQLRNLKASEEQKCISGKHSLLNTWRDVTMCTAQLAGACCYTRGSTTKILPSKNSFRYFSYRAQSFILNYVIAVKMSNVWKEEFNDIPWLADEQIQRFVLSFYAISASGHGQLWRQTSITVKSRSKLARGLEKASKAACIKSQTKQSTNVNK